MTTVLLSLGSNLRPHHYLRLALDVLQERFGRIVVSPAYRTPAVGFDGPDFLNNAVMLETDLPLAELDDWLHAVEDAHGRDRSGPRYSDRTLDIDIVLFDDAVLDGAGNLRIPRDELRHAFVLKPAAEIAPDWRHPLDGTPLAQRWAAHPDRDTAFARVGGFDPAPGV